MRITGLYFLVFSQRKVKILGKLEKGSGVVLKKLQIKQLLRGAQPQFVDVKRIVQTRVLRAKVGDATTYTYSSSY